MQLESDIDARRGFPPRLLAEQRLGRRVAKLRFAREGTSLVALLADSPQLAAWRVATPTALSSEPQLVQIPGSAPRILDLAFSQRGDKLAVAGRGTPLFLLDYPSLHTRAELGDPAQRGYSALAFCSGDRLLIAAGNGPQRTDLFRVHSGERFGSYWGGSLTSSVAVHPEGELIAGTVSEQGGSEVRFVHITESGVQPLAPAVCTYLPVAGIVWSPTGRSFAVVGGWESVSVDLYSFPNIREQWSFMAEPRSKANYSLDPDTPLFEQVLFSPDGQLLLAPVETGEVVLLSAATGERLSGWSAHSGPVTALAADPTGQVVATAGEDRCIRLWSSPFATATARRTGHDLTRAFLTRARPVSLPVDEYEFEELSTQILDAMANES